MFDFNRRPMAAAALACISLGFAHAASAATAERLSRPEVLKLNECMAMTPDTLAKDAQCGTVMKKASLTRTDLEKMRRCEQVQNDVMSDPDCVAMIEKHPELVRGHGRIQPEQPPAKAPTP